MQVGTVIEAHFSLLQHAQKSSICFAASNCTFGSIYHQHVSFAEADEFLSNIGDGGFPVLRRPRLRAYYFPQIAAKNALHKSTVLPERGAGQFQSLRTSGPR